MEINYVIENVRDFGSGYNFEGFFEITDKGKVVKRGMIRHSMTNPYEIVAYESVDGTPRWKVCIDSLMKSELKGYEQRVSNSVSDSLKPELGKKNLVKKGEEV